MRFDHSGSADNKSPRRRLDPDLGPGLHRQLHDDEQLGGALHEALPALQVQGESPEARAALVASRPHRRQRHPRRQVPPGGLREGHRPVRLSSANDGVQEGPGESHRLDEVSAARHRTSEGRDAQALIVSAQEKLEDDIC